jgi:translation initiation factor 2 gamma subunit (eIF-2gamma)
MPEVYNQITINFHLLTQLLGVRSTQETNTRVRKLQEDEYILINIAACTVTGKVKKANK